MGRKHGMTFETPEQALRALLDTPLYMGDGLPVTVGTFLPDEANAARELLPQSAFDPALVRIERHRPTVTQGEVSVSYDGRLLGRYGDDIAMLKRGQEPEPGAQAIGGWAGRGDAHWHDVARSRIGAAR